MNPITYDIEIARAVPPADDADRAPGIEYCAGWEDHAGMGIALITAYDIWTAEPRVFMPDNLAAFAALVHERDAIIGFNNWRFDDRILEVNGIAIAEGKSIDLAALIWRAAGIPQGEHPSGMGLEAICQANKLPGKRGKGDMAPILYQTDRIGELVDYGLTDTLCTLRLYRYLQINGGCRDPRNGEWLNVTVPR